MVGFGFKSRPVLSDRATADKQSVFSLEGDTVLVTRNASVERSAVPGMESVRTRHEHGFQVRAQGGFMTNA